MERVSRVVMRIAGRLALAALLALPARGAAQRIEVPAAPWGSARPAVIAGIERLGYVTVQDTLASLGLPLLTFVAGSAQLSAAFDSTGLVMLIQIQRLPSPEAQRRFAEMRDSLVRVLGEPDSAGTPLFWTRPDGRIRLRLVPDSSGLTSAAIVTRAAPNSLEALRLNLLKGLRARRQWQGWVAARVDTLRWVPLLVKDTMAISFDRESVERRPSGAWRLTVRWDLLVPTDRGRWRFDAIVHESEVRCDEGTYRMGRGWLRLGTATVASTGSGWDRFAPPVPTSGNEVIMLEFCAWHEIQSARAPADLSPGGT
jgi:hypothetical protein